MFFLMVRFLMLDLEHDIYIVSYTRSETIVIERVARLFFIFYDALNHAKG